MGGGEVELDIHTRIETSEQICGRQRKRQTSDRQTERYEKKLNKLW